MFSEEEAEQMHQSAIRAVHGGGRKTRVRRELTPQQRVWKNFRRREWYQKNKDRINEARRNRYVRKPRAYREPKPLPIHPDVLRAAATAPARMFENSLIKASRENREAVVERQATRRARASQRKATQAEKKSKRRATA